MGGSHITLVDVTRLESAYGILQRDDGFFSFCSSGDDWAVIEVSIVLMSYVRLLGTDPLLAVSSNNSEYS